MLQSFLYNNLVILPVRHLTAVRPTLPDRLAGCLGQASAAGRPVPPLSVPGPPPRPAGCPRTETRRPAGGPSPANCWPASQPDWPSPLPGENRVCHRGTAGLEGEQGLSPGNCLPGRGNRVCHQGIAGLRIRLTGRKDKGRFYLLLPKVSFRRNI